MKTEQKQVALNRYRDILQATLNYLIEKHGGTIVYDQIDSITEYYQEQQKKMEKYFQQRKLDMLKKSFVRLTQIFRSSVDLKFETYIKAKTGHEIDIFEDLRKSIDTIIAQAEIRNKREQLNTITMLNYFRKTSANNSTAKQLENLLSNYHSTVPKKSDGHTHIINRTEHNGIVTIKAMSYTGPKIKHYVEEEIISPNEKLKLIIVQQSAGNYAYTTVSILFPKTTGEIYRVDGIHPDINAFWKNNVTIVIETKKEYTVHAQFKKIRSFNDMISIEYVETSQHKID